MNRLAPEWLVTIGFVIGAVFAILAMNNSNTGIPLCQEDEVLTQTRECVAIDDADYQGGIGWTAK